MRHTQQPKPRPVPKINQDQPLIGGFRLKHLSSGSRCIISPFGAAWK
jgi:hypothetical protein